jgi:hypothetical protein
MKCLLLLLVLVVCTAMGSEANRAKRFAGFGAFSAAGGRIGCVVSENGPNNASLYINSHFTKFLSDDEIQELSQYKEKLTTFKSEVKAYLEQRQRQVGGQFRQGQLPPPAPGRNSATEEEPSPKRTNQPSSVALQQPQPPKKPSFCNDKATTQFVFDGCSVQGDNVYVGDNFVRKLTPQEQEELEQFDKQFTAYQRQVTSNFRSQVEDIFGKQFGQLFGNVPGSKSAAGSTAVETSSEAPVSNAAPIEPPKTPNFCTLVI